jgi:hypothetical protein
MGPITPPKTIEEYAEEELLLTRLLIVEVVVPLRVDATDVEDLRQQRCSR